MLQGRDDSGDYDWPTLFGGKPVEGGARLPAAEREYKVALDLGAARVLPELSLGLWSTAQLRMAYHRIEEEIMVRREMGHDLPDYRTVDD